LTDSTKINTSDHKPIVNIISIC